MRRLFPVQQVQAAAEEALQQLGYRTPYQYVDEIRISVGEELGNFVYLVQYQVRTASYKRYYVVLIVDANPATDELEAKVLCKQANTAFTYDQLQYSLYR